MDEKATASGFAQPDIQLDKTIEAMRNTALFEAGPVVTVRAAAEGEISFRRGDRLGRFFIVDELGRGAMGVVVSAYDPDLDRKVAIKVLRSELAVGETATHGQQRLAREAQAMAKLQHPNVVTVFEVGTVQHQVFVAMEFIDGQTLKAWLKEQPRGWRQVVELFVQAGQGLAAAHAAGLVHRDFKAENVLLRPNGIACVADFGLASAAGAALPEEAALSGKPSKATKPSERLPLNMTLTRTGQLLGTPAYMSPEQFLRKRVDAKADQFSFCAALYEALFDTLPYDGETMAELQASVAAGKVQAPPASTNVPPWITAALTRGLSPDPGKRFPDVDSLLGALTTDPTAGRKKALVRAGLAAALAALVLLLVIGPWRREQGRSCSAVAAEIGDVWDEPTRETVKRAFSATGSPDAEETFIRVDRALSAYVKAWKAMRTEACEATFARHEQTQGLLERRVQCLHRRRQEVTAVARILSRGPDKELLGNAVQVSMSLTPLAACADTDSLLAAVPPPEDPAVRARVEELRRKLDHVAALNMTNTTAAFVEGSQIANEAAREADATGYRPIQAEALRWVADMQYGSRDFKGAEATFQRALLAAAEARDDHLGAVVLARLLRLMAYDQGRNADSLALVPVAEAATVRTKDDVLRGQVVFEHAFLLDELGRGDESKQEAERALGVAEKALGSDHADVAEMIDFLGILEARAGRIPEAVAHHERAEATMVRALGPGHNKVAEILNNLCKAYKDWGQYARGQPACERSIAIAVIALGPEFQGVGCTRNHYAEVLCGQGKHAEGVAEAKTALSVLERSVGPEHRWVAASLTALGVCLVGWSKPDEALAPLERSLSLRARKPGHPLELAKTQFAMARALLGAHGDETRALALAKQALEAYSKAPGPRRVEHEALERWLGERAPPAPAARKGRQP